MTELADQIKDIAREIRWLGGDDNDPGRRTIFSTLYDIGSEVAALQAERDGLAADVVAGRGQNAKLRAACSTALDWIVRFSIHSPIAFGGEAELGDELTEALAPRALGEPPTT